MDGTRNWVRSGIIAGIAAAVVVAFWFLALDLFAGEPFRTPAFLAGALFGAAAPAFGVGPIILYTLIHVAAFVVLGIIAAWAASSLRVVPPVLLGIALGFLMFDLIFWGSVAVTGVDIVRSLGWPALLAGNLIAGIVLMVVLTMRDVARPVTWSQALENWGAIREGVIAGLIGATAVALWFLAIDLVQGRPFFTPAALGSALTGGARTAAEVTIGFLEVFSFTIVHVAAFVITGLVAAGVLRVAERTSQVVLIGGVLLFFVFEAFSIGLLAIVSQWLLDSLTWWSVAVANLLAAVSMGVYLARQHRGLLRRFSAMDAEERFDAPRQAESTPT